MFYAHPVYRPPSEADSLLIQVTVGCNHPSCKFCFCSLLTKNYPRDKAAILDDIDEAAQKYREQVEKVFLLLASALSADTELLNAIAERCRERFPKLRSIACYGHPLDIMRKSDSDLELLAQAGFTRIYVGLESGSEQVLRAMAKGVTPRQVEDACLRVVDAGITLSCQVILGLGGARYSAEHATETAKLLSTISPNYVGFLSLVIAPRTKLAEQVTAGTFEVLSEDDNLEELERIISGIHARKPILIRTNHPSNYLALRGTLPNDKQALLDHIHSVRSGAQPRNDEFFRNL